MAAPPPTPKILIIGCSVAGPTLASFLLLSPPLNHVDNQHPSPYITLLERSPSIRTEGQNIDIRGAGLTIIRKLGLEGQIRASTTGEEGVQWVDGENRVWAQLAAGRGKGVQKTPTADVEILRGALAEICYQRCRDVSRAVAERDGGGERLETVFGDYVEEIVQDDDDDDTQQGKGEGKVHVRFAKSRELRSYDLVVGADGLQSRTRRMVWGAQGEKEHVKPLGLYAGFFSMPRGETDTLWRRWYHAPGRRGIMLRPDQQRNRTTALLSIVNERDPRFADVATRLDKKEQKELLEVYFRGCGWESERVLNEMNATDDFYYDMAAQVKMDKWSKGNVVLVGDAGYCASPISGMGTTLALNGAYHLAGALSHHPEDYKAAFAEYETQMRPLVASAQKLVPGVPHILHPETAWGVWMTNAILGFLSWSGITGLLFTLFAKKEDDDTVPVKEYGFRQILEVMGRENQQGRLRSSRT